MPRSPAPDSDDALLRLLKAVRDTGYRFVTPTPATHARVNGRPENEEARDLRDVLGWSRPFKPAALPPAVFELMRQGGVLDVEGERYRSTVRVSTLGKNFFLHSAFPTGEADAVFFGPDTYRFANAITDAVTARRRPVGRAVDIGCGAGPGAIVIAKALPDAAVFMVDINDAALRLARLNATFASAGNAVARRSDLLREVEGEFDLVVANPPYMVDPAKRAYRHGGGPLGADLSLAILDAASERLAPGGTLLLYTGAAIVRGHDPFLAAVTERLAGGPDAWSYREADPDVFGEELDTEAYRHAERIAAVVLTLNRNG